MKKQYSLTITIALLFALLNLGSLSAQEECVCPASTVINCGHRGTGVNSDNNIYPENTIESMLAAAEEGADMVELDVVHSSDGVLVVIHDDTVDRTTDGTGCVGEMTVTELQALDAGYGTASAGEGIVIPTLAEVIEAVDIDINIELKMSGGDCPDTDLDAMAADVVDAINADTKSRTIVISSFSFEVLEKVRALDDDIYIGYLDIGPQNAEAAAAAGFDAINFRADISGAEAVETIHAAGLDANAWTVNIDFLMEELIDAGIDMIITDEPDLLAEVVAEKCAAYECDQYTDDTTQTTGAADSKDDDDSGLCSTGPSGGNHEIALLLLLTAIPIWWRKRFPV